MQPLVDHARTGGQRPEEFTPPAAGPSHRVPSITVEAP